MMTSTNFSFFLLKNLFLVFSAISLLIVISEPFTIQGLSTNKYLDFTTYFEI